MLFRVFLFVTIIFSINSASQAQNSIQTIQEFTNQYDLILQKYVDNGLVDYSMLSKDPIFDDIVSFTSSYITTELSDNELKAYRINVYNIQVLYGITKEYPISSVQDLNGFFDRQKRTIESMSISLNDYEKQYLLQKFDDPRLHFVLVCGAKGCPPIISTAYKPSLLEDQLDMQTRKALRDESFIKTTGDQVELSQIFKWYAADFGGKTSDILSFINSYRNEKITDSSFGYYRYDWALNDVSSNALVPMANSDNRYVVSAAIPKGSYEFKVFNNLYSQSYNQSGTNENGEPFDFDSRSTFYTTIFSALYGLTRKLNVGITGRYRMVSNHIVDSSPLDVFGARNATSSRNGLTAIGPQIRYAPVDAWENFSIQSSLTFAVGKDLQGNNEKPYIDYQGGVFFTQFFNDFTLNNSFSLFTELDVLLEGIGSPEDEFAFRFSTPLTTILSYFPTPQSTLYIIGGYSPYWESPYDYFYQYGGGAKYQLSSQLEVELLYTVFHNKFLLGQQDGNAATYNFGIRYTL